MATEPNTRAFPVLKEELPATIRAAAWAAARELFEPIHKQWDDEYDAIDRQHDPDVREAANRQFYKVNLPTMMRARDAFMTVPAPTLDALLTKMTMADKSDDEHFDACIADLRQLLRQERQP